MNRRERLMRTLRGEAIDRPAVSFYEINGFDEHPDDPDPFNIYSHASWKPLIDLACDCTDRILLRSVSFNDAPPDPLDERTRIEIIQQADRRITIHSLRAGSRLLTERVRRDRDVNTNWVEEHLLKGADDLKEYLSLPAPKFGGSPDIQNILQTEASLGDTGIVMIDTPDPLCIAASLFSMADFTITALTEQILFRQLLDRFAAVLLPQVEAISQELPGHLWRIYGPEYASPPYLPPRLFREYVVSYVTPMVTAIQHRGGFARLHCHGRINTILDDIAATGCFGLDPIEPPPQGDVQLADVRERFGQQMVLFGNLEASDLEMLPSREFAYKVAKALQEGTAGRGRGFVLMPSACPYGRELPPQALRNYEVMVSAVEAF